jgi:hypothetical protein
MSTGKKVEEFSPKLKMAAKEIQDIMDKYDVAGVAQLHIPGFNEFVVKIDPSFSVVSLNERRELRITPPIEIPGQEAESKQKIVNTVNLLFNLRNHITKVMMVLGHAEQNVRQHFGIKPPAKKDGPVIPLPPDFLNGKRKN